MENSTAIEKNNLTQLNEDRSDEEFLGDPGSQSKASGAGGSASIIETMIMLLPAMIADAIDVLDLTGIGAIVARLIDLPVLGILWLWRLFKKASGQKKDPTLQMLTSMVIEISPVGIIPTWTIFVLYVYFQDTKLGKSTVKKAYQKIKTKIK